LGLVFALIVVGVGYVAIDSKRAESRNEQFVTTFLRDFSSSWDPAFVSDRFTDDNIQQFQSKQGGEVLRDLSKLGKLVSIEKFTTVKHTVMTDATYSMLDFTGTFKNGAVIGRVHVIRQNGALKVKDLGIQAIPGVKTTTSL
jgi:hypothetical protein